VDVFIYYAVFTTKKDTVFFLSSQLLWYTFFIFIADVKSCCCFAETSVKIYDTFLGRTLRHPALFRQENSVLSTYCTFPTGKVARHVIDVA